MISETLPAPTGSGTSSVCRVASLRLIREQGHVSASSSFAWPVFLGNLGLGSGWPRLGSGGPSEGPPQSVSL